MLPEVTSVLQQDLKGNATSPRLVRPELNNLAVLGLCVFVLLSIIYEIYEHTQGCRMFSSSCQYFHLNEERQGIKLYDTMTAQLYRITSFQVI